MCNPLKLRKHRTQMTATEIAALENFVHNITYAVVNFQNDHLRREMQQDSIAATEIIAALKAGEVIELNSQKRCVMRSKRGVCVVVSLQDGNAVTTWRNDPRDNHKSLRLSEYAWNVDAVAVLGGLVR